MTPKAYELEAVAASSRFETVDALALYIARNADVGEKKMARVAGLTVDQSHALLTDRKFRERLTEVLTYSELTPEKEVKVLRRMLNEATSPDSDFRDFRDAATWVYRQGGMLRADKSQVDVGGSIRVAFTLDASAEARPRDAGAYVPPDPLAGVIGLPGAPAEVEAEIEDVDFEPVEHEGVEAGQESGASEDWLERARGRRGVGAGDEAFDRPGAKREPKRGERVGGVLR